MLAQNLSLSNFDAQSLSKEKVEEKKPVESVKEVEEKLQQTEFLRLSDW